MPRANPPPLEPAIVITRGRIDRLTLHEVSDGELDAIEAAASAVQGSQDIASILLNFAIGLMTLFVSLLLSLLTTTIEKVTTFAGFVAVTFSAGIIGAILFVIWYRMVRRSRRDVSTVSQLIQNIRDRLPPQGIQEPPPIHGPQLESPGSQ